MNIIIDVRALIGGNHSGVEVYIKNLLKNLQNSDHNNHYYLFSNAHKSNLKQILHYQAKNFKIVETNLPNKFLNLSLSYLKWPQIDQLIQKKLKTKIKFDLFFMPDLRPFALTKKVKSIGTIHDLSFKHFPDFFSLKSRLWYKIIRPKNIIKRLNKIIAVSEFTKNDLQKNFKINKNKITKIHLGISKNHSIKPDDFKKIQKKYHLPVKYFLFLSTLQPRKNIHRTILAFQKFKQENPNSSEKLVMAGSLNPKVFASNEMHYHSKNIIWTGFIAEEDKTALFKYASVFLYPSLFEGFGIPILEAMQTGTPILTSNSSSMPEISGNAAILINPKSISDIAKGIEKAIHQSQSLKEKMAIQIKKFSWEKCAQKTLKLFEKVLDQR